MTAVNLNDPYWDEPREHPGFSVRRARLGLQAGADRVGVSLWEIPPGETAYPYHYHLVEEELLVVLAGRPSLRGPDGWRELEPGAVVSFPVGPEGAHQLRNRGEDTVRLLAISTSGQPEVVMYPDEGKLGAAERRPDGGGVREFFHLCDAVAYWDGVAPPGD
jgi:uncharacterized cupin superfamily protein